MTYLKYSSLAPVLYEICFISQLTGVQFCEAVVTFDKQLV